MTTLTEKRHPGEFIHTEAVGNRSRGVVTIVSGAGIIAAGTVLGQITTGGKYQASAVGASDGSETAAAINIYEVDATSADVEVTALVRDCEVNNAVLTYHADRDQDAEKTAAHTDLETAGIIVR